MLLRICAFILFLSSYLMHVYSGDTAVQTKPTILVSIPPYGFLVKQIAADTCNVQAIAPESYDPHTYDPNPRHIHNLKSGCIWFQSGEGFESSHEKIFSCPKVDLATNVSLLAPSTSCSGQTTHDIHLWLSPQNLKIQAATIVNTLVHTFPEHKELYLANYNNLIKRLDQLHLQIQEKTKHTQQRHVFVIHNALAYFCRDYNFSIDILEKKCAEPSMQAAMQIFHNLQHHKTSANTLILLKNGNLKSSRFLAKKCNLKTIFIDPYQEDVLKNLDHIATLFSQL